MQNTFITLDDTNIMQKKKKYSLANYNYIGYSC